MASPASSSSSSATRAQLIDDIIQLRANQPPSNFELQELQQLVESIEKFLATYDNNSSQPRRSSIFHPFRRNRNTSHPTRPSVGECLPSASHVSEASEVLSKSVQAVSRQISVYTGKKDGTAMSVLNAVGNVHWVAVGFLLVAAVLERVDTMKHNKEKCLDLLKRMIKLAKTIMKFNNVALLQTETELYATIKECIQLILQGAILCCSRKARKSFPSFLSASSDNDNLEKIGMQMDEKRNQLHFLISSLNLRSNMLSRMPQVPPPNDAVGIDHQIAKVIELLDWESDKPSVAVVVHGLGGSGKTTLADAVYASLKDKLVGWRHSRVILIENLEKSPNVEELQSNILEHLTGMKQNVIDFHSGRQSLKDIIKKESIFLYIDNALFLKPLEKLLPKEITSAKKLRLLLTARETNISGVIEDCRITPCEIYSIDSLSDDAAVQILCRKIDRERETDSILQDRPQAKEIAKKCSCCPLFLEVVGAYLHHRKNSVEAYERVIRFLERGENFCGSKTYIFDESRVLFSYEWLKPSTQEAFLDICYFFYNWKWDEVAWIVGEEELECLKDGALLKRKDERICIHDLILSAGRIKSKNSRFTNSDDFLAALKDGELVSQIRGVWLEGHRSPFHISAQELNVMSQSLRVFAMGDLTIVEGECSKQFNELRFLQVGTVPNLPIDILNLKKLTCIDYGFGKDMILRSYKNLSSLKVLKFKKCNDSRILGFTEFAHLLKIKQLYLDGCYSTETPPTFFKSYNLQKLKLSQCADLEELPLSVCKLRYLEELDLSYCTKLKQLPLGVGQLGTLTTLNLSWCASLQEVPCALENLSSLQSLNLAWCSSLLGLPERLGNLTSLTYLCIEGCKNLSCLPPSIGDLISLSGSTLSFAFCSSLTEVPEEICKYTMLTSISLFHCSVLKKLPSRFSELIHLQKIDLYACESLQELCNDFQCLVGLKELDMRNCKGLSSLPVGFGKLSSLETLDLSGCDKLEELCSDFHCLGALKRLSMCNCKSLSNLPLGFGKLSSLETLDLSACDKLQELCSDFHCLGALKSLNLSECHSLSNLPDCFGQLGCLEIIDLSKCSNLEKLSDDFRCLPSLTKLNLSNCECLGGEWMGTVTVIDSLWRVDIAGSERMIQRWMEMKRDKAKWHFVVVTNLSQNTRALRSVLMLERVLSKVFDEDGLLFDTHQRPFSPSSLLPQTPLVFIIDEGFVSRWELLEKRLQQLECNSNSFQIIYIGREFNALPSELAERILAYTPPNSRTSTFCHKLFDHFEVWSAVFRSNDSLEENGIKCLSTWEDISYIWDEVAFVTRTPRESNIELLTALLVTEETDYLLLNENQQVKVADLQGKVTLLLTKSVGEPEMSISALKDVYLKMQESHKSMVEVVWTPRNMHSVTWEEYERAPANAPWPMVPNPWKMSKELRGLIVQNPTSVVLVVDGQGRIRKEDAMPMIERWGVEAYPFSHSREEELRKVEWEAFKFNSQSPLEFGFHNLEFLSAKAKEAMGRGEMMLLCVGSAAKMMEFAPHLNSALTMLECDTHVLYVGVSPIYCSKKELNEFEIKRQEIISTTPSLSLSDVYKFWRRVLQLQNVLNAMEMDEKIVKARRMALGLASADVDSESNEKGISIVMVDENGEIISGSGMELVHLLLHGDEDEKKKLLMDIKSGGLKKCMEMERWRNGMIHPKHYPQHCLLKLKGEYNNRVPSSCGLCSDYIYRSELRYQCNVCGKYLMCETCYKKQ